MVKYDSTETVILLSIANKLKSIGGNKLIYLKNNLLFVFQYHGRETTGPGQRRFFKNKIHVRLFSGTSFICRLATATRFFNTLLYKNT